MTLTFAIKTFNLITYIYVVCVYEYEKFGLITKGTNILYNFDQVNENRGEENRLINRNKDKKINKVK